MASGLFPIFFKVFASCLLIQDSGIKATHLFHSVNMYGLQYCRILLQMPPPPPPPFPPLLHARILKDYPGFQELTGPKGEKGEKGRRGIRGLTGLVGVLGEPGVAGPLALQGQKGQMGESGWLGVPGIQGQAGLKGDPGCKRDRGEQGDKGESIKGEKGMMGARGKDGQKGEISPKGQAGLPGSLGSRGIPGQRGIKGLKGGIGSPGTPGPHGPSGVMGPPGPIGAPGKVHIVPGPKGDMGSPGPHRKCSCFRSSNYTEGALRKDYTDVPAIYVVQNEKDMAQLNKKNMMVLRKDTRTLHFSDGMDWTPVQAILHGALGYCGDGKIQVENEEQCDDGNNDSSDDCIDCKLAVCGDGHVHTGVEECDGKNLGNQTCASYLPGSYGNLKCSSYCYIDSTECHYFS
ncbi:acetylcholinesterase collagenic tail peptide-like [Protopterus annectens]|uniref:acetylcholinesterase collagenic tail peptide-like n=1 Tax=Protopterus annectens TaxID=7888 RepID=UPI001CFB662B|nr:acetylcholinesterase collagenic tail peptide-like [Protopterus annectens]